MKNILSIILFLSCSVAYAANFVPHVDFSYDGAFILSSSSAEDTCFQGKYSAANITFYAAGDGGSGSLFSTGKLGCPTIAEFSIPVAKVEAVYSDLNTATELQGYTNIGNGDIDDGLPDGSSDAIGAGDIVVVGSDQGVTTPQLLHIAHNDFIAETTREYILSSCNLDFTPTVGFNGWWQLANVYPAEAQHYIFTVPKTWADTNLGGNYVIVGSNRQNSNGSFGATMYAIKPFSSGTPPSSGTDLSNTQLVSYGNTANMTNYLDSNNPADFVWVESGTKSAIVCYKVYVGRERLYTDTTTNDWTVTSNGIYYGNRHPEGLGSKGYHGEPYSFSLGFYSTDDIAAVYAGTKDADTVQPYVYYDISDVFYASTAPGTDGVESRGIAYDPDGGKLYVAEAASNATSGRVIIHVFSVSDESGSLDTTPPTDPSNFSVGTETGPTGTVQLSWTGSTDSNGVHYIIYLNGYPVIRTDNTSYSYTYLDDWRDGDDTANGWPSVTDFEFKVLAEDDYHNQSGFSNTDTVGGDVPTSAPTASMQTGKDADMVTGKILEIIE